MATREELLEQLKPIEWVHPSDYSGHSPEGDFLVYTRSRDSCAMERSNFRRILQDLEQISGPLQNNDDPFVHSFQAKHFACGWVEYLIVRRDAPFQVLQKVAEILKKLGSYPVYDEEDMASIERDEVMTAWAEFSEAEREYHLARAGMPLELAQSGEFPQGDTGALFEFLLR